MKKPPLRKDGFFYLLDATTRYRCYVRTLVGGKSSKKSLGFLTQIPLRPFTSSKWWSPLTIIASEASAQATNLSSSGSSQTGFVKSLGTMLVASSSISAIHPRGSMRGTFRCSRSDTSRYSSMISAVTNHLNRSSRQASSTRPGTPPKKMPDIRTFVSSVAFIVVQASRRNASVAALRGLPLLRPRCRLA